MEGLPGTRMLFLLVLYQGRRTVRRTRENKINVAKTGAPTRKSVSSRGGLSHMRLLYTFFRYLRTGAVNKKSIRDHHQGVVLWRMVYSALSGPSGDASPRIDATVSNQFFDHFPNDLLLLGI